MDGQYRYGDQLNMKFQLTIILLWQLGHSAVYANTSGVGPAPIDTQALNNKRLFFSQDQRQNGDLSDVSAGKKELVAQSIDSGGLNSAAGNSRSVPLELDKPLHYTGIVRSARGVQLLLNGYPWTPGQLAIVSARLQPDTQIIEIETTNGVIHRLLPGDTIEVKP